MRCFIPVGLAWIKGRVQSTPGSPGGKSYASGTRRYGARRWTMASGGIPKIKDSGKRTSFASGMVRDTSDGKVNYLLTRSGPMYERWAQHLTTGAGKYEVDNWLKASGPEELRRAKESACRHFEQWLRGDTDEDHAAALYFNVNEVEYIKGRMKG